MEALDWALDPNNDGDDSDHLDIVNLSLGSDYSAEDDPENTMIDKLASYGVLSVVAAGNAGDITLVGGSPGSAASALTVADSVGDTPEDAADTLNSSSSRGTYGSIGTIKPDVAAPGTDIVSAGFGTGNGRGDNDRHFDGHPACRWHRGAGQRGASLLDRRGDQGRRDEHRGARCHDAGRRAGKCVRAQPRRIGSRRRVPGDHQHPAWPTSQTPAARGPARRW